MCNCKKRFYVTVVTAASVLSVTEPADRRTDIKRSRLDSRKQNRCSRRGERGRGATDVWSSWPDDRQGGSTGLLHGGPVWSTGLLQ